MHDGLQKLASISRRASDWPGQQALGKQHANHIWRFVKRGDIGGYNAPNQWDIKPGCDEWQDLEPHPDELIALYKEFMHSTVLFSEAQCCVATLHCLWQARGKKRTSSLLKESACRIKRSNST